MRVSREIVQVTLVIVAHVDGGKMELQIDPARGVEQVQKGGGFEGTAGQRPLFTHHIICQGHHLPPGRKMVVAGGAAL